MNRRPCRKCGRNRAERFFTGPKGSVCTPCQKSQRRIAARSAHLMKTYGITWEQYQAVLEQQGFRCAICWRVPKYSMDVDHDHKTGLVRGLLCKVCNRHLLPAAKDDTLTLEQAMHYLRYPPAIMTLGEVRVPSAQDQAG